MYANIFPSGRRVFFTTKDIFEKLRRYCLNVEKPSSSEKVLCCGPHKSTKTEVPLKRDLIHESKLKFRFAKVFFSHELHEFSRINLRWKSLLIRSSQLREEHFREFLSR